MIRELDGLTELLVPASHPEIAAEMFENFWNAIGTPDATTKTRTLDLGNWTWRRLSERFSAILSFLVGAD